LNFDAARYCPKDLFYLKILFWLRHQKLFNHIRVRNFSETCEVAQATSVHP